MARVARLRRLHVLRVLCVFLVNRVLCASRASVVNRFLVTYVVKRVHVRVRFASLCVGFRPCSCVGARRAAAVAAFRENRGHRGLDSLAPGVWDSLVRFGRASIQVNAGPAPDVLRA